MLGAADKLGVAAAEAVAPPLGVDDAELLAVEEADAVEVALELLLDERDTAELPEDPADALVDGDPEGVCVVLLEPVALLTDVDVGVASPLPLLLAENVALAVAETEALPV